MNAASVPRRASRGIRLAALLVVLLFAIRLVYVSLFGGSVPYWDQWDSEADLLLRPWVQGTWQFADLFHPHNEHRIAFSRLLSIAIFEANDRQWDNLVEACASALLFAGAMAVPFVLLCREAADRATTAAIFATTVVLAALPFEWENFLVGFQNSFYFMAILATAVIALVAFRRLSRSTLLFELGLGVAGLFTLASGLLAAPAAMVVVLMRNWCKPVRSEVLLAFGTVFLSIFVVGALLVPDVPHHRVLHASGLEEHLNAFAVAAMWPAQGTADWSLWSRVALALLMWLPAWWWGLRFVRLRSATGSDLFAAGMAAWVILQAFAMAHSRGHEMSEVSSRYMGSLSLGIPVNVYFALRLLGSAWPSIDALHAVRAAMAVFFIAVAVALACRTPHDLQLLMQRFDLTRVQTENTRAYVATGDFLHLQKPFQHIPYPSAERLRSLLDNPAIRAMLPPSIRAPLPLAPSPPDFSPDGVPSSPALPQQRSALGSFGRPGGALAYRSAALHTPFPYLMFLTLGEGNLALVGDGATVEPGTAVSLRGAADSGWSGHVVAVPAPAFRIEATDAGVDRRLAFTAPVEIGRLSRWALRSQAAIRRVADRLGNTEQRTAESH